jgi:nitrogen regulatory protein P-II 1
MKTIVAIVRTDTLGDIVKALEERGIGGMTITEIKGIGEEVRLYKPYTIHNRIEIIVPDEKVDEVTGVIVRHARTGFAGDGIVGVYPMEYMIKIRTGEKEKE